jgi:hypothetical protein
MGSFTDWADVTHGAEKEFGQLTCGCHRIAASAWPS